MFNIDIVITNFTINNNIINTKQNMTYNNKNKNNSYM